MYVFYQAKSIRPSLIEVLIRYGITAWLRNFPAQLKFKPVWLTQARWTLKQHMSLLPIYKQLRSSKPIGGTVRDPSHVLHTECQLLPSDRRSRVPPRRFNSCKHLTIPVSIKLFFNKLALDEVFLIETFFDLMLTSMVRSLFTPVYILCVSYMVNVPSQLCSLSSDTSVYFEILRFHDKCLTLLGNKSWSWSLLGTLGFQGTCRKDLEMTLVTVSSRVESDEDVNTATMMNALDYRRWFTARSHVWKSIWVD